MSLLGERLQQEREARTISLLQVEIDTRIRATVLQSLEDGDYAHLPPEPFLRGLVRSYATYLRTDVDDALNLLSIDLHAPPAPSRSSSARGYAPPLPPGEPESFLSQQPTISEPVPTFSETQTPAAAQLAPLTSSQPNALGAWIAILKEMPLPMPVMLSVGAVIVLLCVICGAIAFSQINAQPAIIARGTTTATRIPATVTPTLAPGAPPTDVPKIAITAAPFPTFPGNPSPTPRVLPRRTLEAQTGLNLDIDANQSIKVLVGVDNVPVFNGAMDAGTSRSWSAKESLYVRVENAIGANIYFNGKEEKAAVFTERSVMERRWTLDKGTPIRTAPFTPVVPSPTRTFTTTPIFTITPMTFETP
jgi:hypothetical protein